MLIVLLPWFWHSSGAVLSSPSWLPQPGSLAPPARVPEGFGCALGHLLRLRLHKDVVRVCTVHDVVMLQGTVDTWGGGREGGREGGRDGEREGGREGGREGMREGGRDGWRERGREGGREEEGREGGMKGGMEGGREGGREVGREGRMWRGREREEGRRVGRKVSILYFPFTIAN